MTVQATIDWPVKRREIVFWVEDSRPWNDLKFRDDDIVVSTWSKSGTTWMQQIIGQLISGGDPDLYGPEDSPWIDSRFAPDVLAEADAQTHRRYLKTHLPIDALVYSPKAKYIYIGRDIRDVFWSWYNHWANFTPEILDYINGLPGREGPPVGYPGPDIRLEFRRWLVGGSKPNIPFFEHVQGWFDARRLPNLELFHFADLTADLPAEVRRLARFLEIEIDEAKLPAMLEHCSLEHMRKLARRSEILPRIFKQGGDTLIHKGTNGRWRDVLSLEDNAYCDAMAARHLSADCARWLATGQLAR